ncbi:MAG: hypothetical protein HQK51_12620 [Oligoflexia bacterium]|nr:hypothetical protein [Oligoflexia bacterium]
MKKLYLYLYLYLSLFLRLSYFIVSKSLIIIALLIIQKSFAVDGSFKSYFSSLKNPNENSADGLVTNTFRSKFTWTANEYYSFYAAYVLSANVQKNQITHSENTQKRDYRAYDLKTDLYPSNSSDASNMTLAQNLDRLFINYSFLGSNNISLGRQPVAFGSSKMVNPTDVLVPFTYQELDKEERIGVDAIRANISISALSMLDAGHVFGDNLNFSKSSTFLRWKLNLFETDISTMFMKFKKNLLIGMDLARNIGDASGWLEAAYVLPKYFDDFSNSGSDNGSDNDSDNDSDKNYFRGTLGMDYKLTPLIYSYLEYHYNSAGTLDTEKYISLALKTAYREGGVSLKGVHYLIPGITYEITPIWKLTGQFLYNIVDSSILNNTFLEHSFAQDVFIDLGTYLPFGKKFQLTQKSEFGDSPKIFYSSIRLYF